MSGMFATKRSAASWIAPGCLAGAVLVAVGLVPFEAGSAAADEAKQTVVVYTALQQEQLPVYKQAFEAAHPKIEIQWVHGTGAAIATRVISERADPQADAIWGLDMTNLVAVDAAGALAHYKPAGFEMLKDDFKDRRTGWPTWIGMDAWSSAICFNPVVAKAKKVPRPEMWKDLVNPQYKDQVVAPNPAASPTGFLTVSGWLQMFGDTGAWDFMDLLNENVRAYLPSGLKPCEAVADGAVAVGIGHVYAGVKLHNDGKPVEVILPTEGIGWEMEAAAVVKGSRHLQAAQALEDFAASAEANKMYNSYYQVLARKDVAAVVPDNYPADAEAKLMLTPNDFFSIAPKNQIILDEWKRRYGGKAAPKS
jgi:iron(III) transport system substrate-binding protein